MLTPVINWLLSKHEDILLETKIVNELVMMSFKYTDLNIIELNRNIKSWIINRTKSKLVSHILGVEVIITPSLEYKIICYIMSNENLIKSETKFKRTSKSSIEEEILKELSNGEVKLTFK